MHTPIRHTVSGAGTPNPHVTASFPTLLPQWPHYIAFYCWVQPSSCWQLFPSRLGSALGHGPEAGAGPEGRLEHVSVEDTPSGQSRGMGRDGDDFWIMFGFKSGCREGDGELWWRKGCVPRGMCLLGGRCRAEAFFIQPPASAVPSAQCLESRGRACAGDLGVPGGRY